MKATFDLRNSVNDNAAIYFEKSKKLKSKVDGIEKTLSVYEAKKKSILKESDKHVEKMNAHIELHHRKKEWYEKFRWFYTSNGSLCIGGRDASSNEVVIKKYTEEGDLVFHTDMAGSPFFVLKKREGVEFDVKDINDVANVTACYSRAWKKGLMNTDVFYVNPDQVTKEANAGESLAKGSFVIRGKTNYIENELKLGIAVDSAGRPVCGSVESIKQYEKYIILVQGDLKASDVAKKMKAFFKTGLIDEFVKLVPSGGAKILTTKYE